LEFKKIAQTAWATREGFGIWLAQAKFKKPQYKFNRPGLHRLCFKVKSKQVVDRTYQFLLAKKVFIYDSPEHYPE